ncbi:MAG: anti-sigma F factor [Lachnospiraceae bacterium]|nr:anti-sigma F factor [Lachnospiraceae bacterium]
MNDQMIVEFDSISKNESFARVVVAAFVSRLNPTLEEIADIKTAVSEAVTNSIIHGYENGDGRIRIETHIVEDTVTVMVKDFGTGIADVEKAMEPMYTSKPELERSGMGFAFMEAFMDELFVDSTVGQGTTVTMRKVIRQEKNSRNQKAEAGTVTEKGNDREQ